jgi:hypothetical protein
MIDPRALYNAQRLNITVHRAHYRYKVPPKGNYLTNNLQATMCDITPFLHK